MLIKFFLTCIDLKEIWTNVIIIIVACNQFLTWQKEELHTFSKYAHSFFQSPRVF